MFWARLPLSVSGCAEEFCARLVLSDCVWLPDLAVGVAAGWMLQQYEESGSCCRIRMMEAQQHQAWPVNSFGADDFASKHNISMVYIRML